jgi:predicted DNA-binding transcriptional regulator
MDLFSVFKLEKNEKLIYEILEKRPMTIKQLQKTTRVSERMLRTYLDDMIRRGFVKKKVVEGNRLKYVYKATEPQTILDHIKTKVTEIEKETKRAKKEIIRGSKF